MFRLKKPPPDARIWKIRQREEWLEKMTVSAKESQALGAIADWEASTDKKNVSIKLDQMIAEKKARRDADLDARREKLASMLQAEEIAFQNELATAEETPEELRDKMAKRARQLAAAREEERKIMKAHLEERHFRENCDPLREKLSQKIHLQTCSARSKQVEDRKKINAAKEEEQRLLVEMEEIERLKKERRFLQDQAQKSENEQELRKAISDQIAQATEEKRLERMVINEEAETLKKSWRKMEEEGRLEQAKVLEQKRNLAVQMDEFRHRKHEELRDAWNRERELEQEYLRACSASDAAMDEKARAVKEKVKKEMVEYRNWLLDQTCLGEEEKDKFDEIVAREYQKICSREDATQKAQADARQKLAKEVQIVREHQIKEKKEERLQKLEETRLERLKAQEEESQMKLMLESEKNKQKAAALEYKLNLQAQMICTAQKKAMEEEDHVLEIQAAREVERKYCEKIAEALNSDPLEWYGRKKVEWFY